MLVVCRFRTEQKIDKIDPPSIYRFERNGGGQARENRHRLCNRGKSRVGQGNTLTDAGAAHALAFLQGRQKLLAIQLRQGRRDAGQFFKQSFLVAHAHSRENQINHA